MITHKFKCTECKKVREIDFTSISEYETLKHNMNHYTEKCRGELERYYGSGDVPAIRTTSSPNR